MHSGYGSLSARQRAHQWSAGVDSYLLSTTGPIFAPDGASEGEMTSLCGRTKLRAESQDMVGCQLTVIFDFIQYDNEFVWWSGMGTNIRCNDRTHNYGAILTLINTQAIIQTL